MQIQNTKDISPTTLTFLIYGQSGSGKTTLAKTMPGRTLGIDCENGFYSLKDAEIDYINIQGENEQDKITNLWSAMSMAEDYDNIYIDSLTEINQWLLAVATTRYPSDTQTQKRFGFVKEKTESFIKLCRDFKKNIILTALEKVEKNDVGRRYSCPQLIGQLSMNCPIFFDFVFNLQVITKNENKIRTLLTDAKDNILAKSRSQNLDEFEPADLSIIFKKLKGEKNV